MINWLKRLFGGSDSSEASTSTAPEPAETPAQEPLSTATPDPTAPQPSGESASGTGDEPV